MLELILDLLLNRSPTFWAVLLLSPVVLFPVTWAFYVFAMSIQEKRKALQQDGRDFHVAVKVFALIFVFIGVLCDAYMQLVTFTLMTAELPKYHRGERLVSDRLQRTKHLVLTRPSGLSLRWVWYCRDWWARAVGRHVCREWLEPFDACHCEP